LENRRSENDEMSGRMWKTVEANTGKVRIEEAEERESKGRSRKKMRGKGKEKETEEKKDGRSEENSKGVGNLR